MAQPTDQDLIFSAKQGHSEGHSNLTEIKLADPVPIDESVALKLRSICDLADQGKISDYVIVFLQADGPAFSHSYRIAKRAQMIGLLEILKANLAAHFDLEEKNDNPDDNKTT